MEDSSIQFGIPCQYPELCDWIGVALGVIVVCIIAGLVYAVLRDQKQKRLNREQRRQRRQKNAQK
jgi:heme exporter protein D